jgi:hypothetical protein
MHSQSPSPPVVGSAQVETRRAAWFVTAVWAAMTASTLVFVYRHGFTSPWADELRWMPQIAGQEPLTARWFLEMENQHVLPLVKLAYMGLGRATDFDFRDIAFLNAILLVGTALAMMIAVARMRGQASVLDVLIPVALLHWGHYLNLIWGFQLCYVLPTALGCLLLLVVSANRTELSVGRACLASTLTIAAALCGGPGIFYLWAMAAWIAYGGLRRWRSHRPAAVAIMVLAVLSLLPLALWVPTLLQVKGVAASGGQGWRVMLPGTLQFLSMSPGKTGGETHPFSGLVVLILIALAAWILWRAWRREPEQRLRAAGLGLFLGGCLSMALGIGLTRGAIGCLQGRYILLASPLVLGLYLVGVCYGPAIRRGGVRWACVAALVGLAILYNVKGLRLTPDIECHVRRLEESVREGLPIPAIAARYFDDMQDPPAESFTRDLERMRAAGLGPYRRGQPVGPQRNVVVASMLPIPSPPIPADVKVLGGRDELVQPFVATHAIPLYRIDVEAYPSRRAAVRIRWEIIELDEKGQRTTRAQGQYAFDPADPGYARLVFEPFTPTPSHRLELRIVPDGDTAGRLRVPQYPVQSQSQRADSPLGIRGFLYYERDARPAASQTEGQAEAAGTRCDSMVYGCISRVPNLPIGGVCREWLGTCTRDISSAL